MTSIPSLPYFSIFQIQLVLTVLAIALHLYILYYHLSHLFAFNLKTKNKKQKTYLREGERVTDSGNGSLPRFLYWARLEQAKAKACELCVSSHVVSSDHLLPPGMLTISVKLE